LPIFWHRESFYRWRAALQLHGETGLANRKPAPSGWWRSTRRGIGWLIHYPIPPHLQQAYADLGLRKGSFPLAEELAGTVLSLPMGNHMTLEEVDEVAAVVRAELR
jgi:DegT/DnrJ/EryC1/StrS aminotransferase family